MIGKIEIEYPADYRLCNCCGEKGVVEIAFRMIYSNKTSHGTGVALCGECLKKLKAVLEQEGRGRIK